MKRSLITTCLLSLIVWPTTQADAQQEKIGQINIAQAAAYLAEFKEACVLRDGGRLWGVEVFGPVLLVDPRTRNVIANQADGEGLLSERSGVFVGKLPRDKPLANAPITWGGVRWAMVIVMFLSDDQVARVTLLAHESFHRVQPELGLLALGEETDHLDMPDGRYWLQLEWNALQTAVTATGDARLSALRDSMTFRAARRAQYPDAAPRENAVEIREGLAQYTGMRIGGCSATEMVELGKKMRTMTDGLVRSFGYISGPLYGYLLDDATNEAWRKSVNNKSDLGAMLAEALRLKPDVDRASERSLQYGGAALRTSENERERSRQTRLAAFRELLVVGPVLFVDLSLCSSKTLDTRYVHPLGEGRTVYGVRTLIAEWGTLQVSNGGAILEDSSTSLGRVSLRNAAADHLSGEGWTLNLKEGWTIVPNERQGDLMLRWEE